MIRQTAGSDRRKAGMKITKTTDGTSLTFALEGRLDTISSKDLEKELRTSAAGITELVFDFEKLSYITSAGLRVLSMAQKMMRKQGHMVIRNPQPDVQEVFDVTGLSAFLEIE